MNEKAVIMELQRTVQTLEAKRIDGLLREAALLQERDEARAEASRLKEVLSLAATCILKQCRCMEECGCVPASVLAALPKEES